MARFGGPSFGVAVAADPRVPGLRVIVALPAGKRALRRRWSKSDLVVDILRKPITEISITEMVGRHLTEFPLPKDISQ